MIAKRICAPLLAAAALMLSGCLSMKSYVDPTLGELKTTDRAAPAAGKPAVQLVFDFQTNGSANARAISLFSKQVTDQVTASGLFSQVSATPAAGGAIISITVNNIAQKDAASKGFVTGLTFGLAGSVVTDYYVGTLKYVPTPGAAVITEQEKHAIHTQVGAGAGPANMTPAKNLEDAARTMMRQLVDHMLDDLAKDPAYSGQKTGIAFTRTVTNPAS